MAELKMLAHSLFYHVPCSRSQRNTRHNLHGQLTDSHEEAEVDVPRRLKLLVNAGHQPRRLIDDLPLEGLGRRRPPAADSITNKWESHKSKIGANGPNSATAARARWRKGGKPQKPRRSSSSSPRPPVRGWDPVLTHQADNIPAR